MRMNECYRGRCWDPLYGRTELSHFEYALLSTPEVQRLRYIRMCNINSMLVTGASEISRFEHSLGVLRLTQEWIDAHQNRICEADAVALRAAALLHDIQTGPFGHSFQYILEDNQVRGDFAHDDLSHGREATYYQDLPANAAFAGKPFGSRELLGTHWSAVASIIQGNGIYGPLISGSMDFDNLDNVIRLAYHVGLASHDDADLAIRIARGLELRHGGLAIPLAILAPVRRWQEIRRRLYEFLLLDWAEFSAKAMLTLAMELAVEHDLVGSDSWIMTDDELLFDLEKRGIGEAQDVADLIRRLRRGDLYHPVALYRTRGTAAYAALNRIERKREFERQLARYAKRDLKFSTRILVHYICDKRKTDRAIEVVIAETGDQQFIGNDSDVLLIGIFSSSQLTSKRTGQALVGEALRLLNQSGLHELEPLEDPFGSPLMQRTVEQLSFL